MGMINNMINKVTFRNANVRSPEEIKADISSTTKKLNAAANFFLTPARHLFGGKSINCIKTKTTTSQGEVSVLRTAENPTKNRSNTDNLLRTVASVVTFIVSVPIGLILKSAAIAYSEKYENNKLARRLDAVNNDIEQGEFNKENPGKMEGSTEEPEAKNLSEKSITRNPAFVKTDLIKKAIGTFFKSLIKVPVELGREISASVSAREKEAKFESLMSKSETDRGEALNHKSISECAETLAKNKKELKNYSCKDLGALREAADATKGKMNVTGQLTKEMRALKKAQKRDININNELKSINSKLILRGLNEGGLPGIARCKSNPNIFEAVKESKPRGEDNEKHYKMLDFFQSANDLHNKILKGSCNEEDIQALLDSIKDDTEYKTIREGLTGIQQRLKDPLDTDSRLIKGEISDFMKSLGKSEQAKQLEKWLKENK
jgi:hypothetical protein